MARYAEKNRQDIGASPETLIFIGEQKMDKPLLRLIDYNEEKLIEKTLDSIDEVLPYVDNNSVTWLNIDGLHDIELMNNISDKFNLSKMMFADLLNTITRPKVQEYGNGLFISLKMLRYNEEDNEIIAENLSFILSKKLVISFQEHRGDVFEPVRDRIRKSKIRIRKASVDYLLCALLDVVIDNYIYVISRIGEKIELLDDELFESPQKDTLETINDYKREINYIRKLIKPVYEVLMKLNKLETDFIQDDNEIFYKELEHNINHAIDSSENYREILSDQLNVYHTTISSKLNDVMKILTVFSVVFIPLTFIAGIYGTNFDNIPELHFQYGYFMMWGAMVIVTIGMLYYFKRKDWF